jgi:replicative superfamily II helicase
VYIAPLKALARERLRDWKEKFGRKLGLTVLEFTGDAAPDAAALRRADIIITTPEKWDGVTRGWKSRPYVSSTSSCCTILNYYSA